MISGAREEDGSSMPGRTMRPVIAAASFVLLRLFCVELIVAVVLVDPHDPAVAGEAALPALKTSMRRPMLVVVCHVPDVSPATEPVTKFQPTATAFSS